MKQIVWMLLGVALGANAAAPSVPATSEEIVARMMAADETRTAKLMDYTSVRRYSLENKRFGVRAAMTVKVTYKSPGPKRFQIVEESGPGAIRTKVFKRMLDSELQASEATRISSANYVFRLIDSRVLDGRECFVLDAAPKTNNPLLFRGQVYVDTEDYAVARIDAAPAQNPSFWLRKTAIAHRFAKYGQFWLPLSNDSGSDVRVFGHTQVRIDYSEYRINARVSATDIGE